MTTDVAALSPAEARRRFRDGLVTPTSGWSAGYAQANLVAVPRDYAFDLLVFAQRNPKSCPILDVLEPGQFTGPLLGEDGDIRTDVPAYRIYRDGVLREEVPDATEYWREDLVAFLVGCSFSFEDALLEAGVPVRHIEEGRNVPMFRTNRPCRSAGRLSGPLVVSMRPIPAGQVADAVRVTSRYPGVHGAPVHVGDPAALGIADLSRPDFGDAGTIRPGEIPVFWACGVTPQAAVMESRPPLAIGHAPGHMLVTDLRDSTLLVP
ncbi:putative hydro-lyase [Aeromicrobium phragmitis]|uniref:Putative hydro-lyase D9V41_15850 n=1 Tax=Aeromicrobium phragmitis TaxID=2478914 RepID=A0A3L8PHA7_9ACTN|nr:putative hydro-lyase [Aeromicrobium phragmitis]RLV54597.1 putative hydro-lyase [Aeromicrobium phragmitis]